ncbi:MAG: hypothetical protein JWL63_2518 [Rhodocyclales bacterium]|nr:hypothetical protein [Rhodocyclales bacterium]
MKKLMSFVLLLSVLLASACSGTKKTDWKEEVKLADGSVIIVQRMAEAHVFGEMGGPGGLRDLKESLQVVSGHSSIPLQWNDIYVPILLDYDKGRKEWLLVTSFYMCEDWYRLGRPALPYLEYRVRNGKWMQVSFDTGLIGRETNLLLGPNFSHREPELLRLPEKIGRRGKYEDSLKKIVANWHTAC